MIEPGRYHSLTASDMQEQGLYLKDEDGERVLLPRRQVPEGTEIGDVLNVFIYLDSDDRLIATTLRPKAQAGEVASLMVKDVNATGAFLDWGLPKDLFVPFGEQKQRLEAGQNAVVYITEDNTGRLIGTTRLNRFIKDEATANWPGSPAPLAQGDKVKLLVAQRTDIGYKAVVNNTWWGLLHDSQIHKAIRVGQKMEGFVRRIRDDHRLDLSLEPLGHTRADPLAKKILKKLEESGGQLGIGDHTPPDLIELHFGVSKRAFKMAIGKLFKEGEIVIEEDGIRLGSEGTAPRSENSPYGKRDSGDKRPYGDKRASGDKRPYGDKRESGDKRPYGDKRPNGDKRESGDKRPYGDKRESGDKRPYGEKRPYGDKRESGDKRPYGDKRASGEKRPYGDKRESGEKRPYGDKRESSDKRRSDDRGERKPFRDGKPQQRDTRDNAGKPARQEGKARKDDAKPATKKTVYRNPKHASGKTLSLTARNDTSNNDKEQD